MTTPTILSDNDYVAAVEGIEKFNVRLGKAIAMRSYFVDIFPWMKYIPLIFSTVRLLAVSADG